MKYQVMRDLTPEEYSELKQSIMQSGVVVPIVLDEDGNVLDGHHRLKICDELGITDYPTEVKAGLNEAEKITLARELNEARRQLSAEEKRREIERRLRETPELSDRQIAKQVGVSHATVGTKRQELESIGQIDQCDRETSDGRIYPAQRKEVESRAEIPHVDKITDTLGREQPRQVQRNSDEPTNSEVITVITSPEESDTAPAEDSEPTDYIAEYLEKNQVTLDEYDEEEDEPSTNTKVLNFAGNESPQLKVLDIAAYQKNKADSEYEKFIDGGDRRKELEKAVNRIKKLNFTDDDINSIVYWHNSVVIRDLEHIDETISDINEAIKILREIGLKLLQSKGNNYGKNRY